MMSILRNRNDPLVTTLSTSLMIRFLLCLTRTVLRVKRPRCLCVHYSFSLVELVIARQSSAELDEPRQLSKSRFIWIELEGSRLSSDELGGTFRSCVENDRVRERSASLGGDRRSSIAATFFAFSLTSP